MSADPLFDFSALLPRRFRRPRPDYVLVLPQRAHRALEVRLDGEDNEVRCGSTVDRDGNRIEVIVHDGDPYTGGGHG